MSIKCPIKWRKKAPNWWGEGEERKAKLLRCSNELQNKNNTFEFRQKQQQIYK